MAKSLKFVFLGLLVLALIAIILVATGTIQIPGVGTKTTAADTANDTTSSSGGSSGGGSSSGGSSGGSNEIKTSCDPSYKLNNNKCEKCGNNNNVSKWIPDTCFIKECEPGFNNVENESCVKCDDIDGIKEWGINCEIESCEDIYKKEYGECKLIEGYLKWGDKYLSWSTGHKELSGDRKYAIWQSTPSITVKLDGDYLKWGERYLEFTGGHSDETLDNDRKYATWQNKPGAKVRYDGKYLYMIGKYLSWSTGHKELSGDRKYAIWQNDVGSIVKFSKT